jgi:membrane protein
MATTPPPASRRPADAIRHEPGFRGFLQDVWLLSVQAEIDVQASQMAFNTVFSLGPILALAAALLSLLPAEAVAAKIQEVIFPYVPAAVIPLLQAQLESRIEGPNPWFVVGSVLALFWTLSSAAVAITTALGFIGWPQSGSFWKRRLRAFVIGLVVVLGIATSALAAVVGPFVLEFMGRALHVAVPRLSLIAWLRWPIAGLVYGVGCGLLVRYGTKARPVWRSCGVGGAVTAVVATAASALLRIVFAHSPSLGAALGTAGAVFAALLWLYVLAIGFMLGAIVAFVLEERAGRLKMRHEARAMVTADPA